MKLDQLFDNNFDGFQLPRPNRIQWESISREYPNVNFDDVWRGVLLLAIQEGVIVRASKEAGIIVTLIAPPLGKSKGEQFYFTSSFPMVVLIERKQERIIVVYANWLDELYQWIGKSEALVAGEIKHEDKEKFAKRFLDNLETQVSFKYKWKYLFD